MSEDKSKAAMERVREYSKKYYLGGSPALEKYELFGRYLPDTMGTWIDLRKSVFPDPPEEGGLSAREKELICTAIEIAALKPDSNPHARLAIKRGATPKQVAEVAAICILLGGMVTYMTSGHNALRGAEEEYEKMMKEKGR